MAASDERQRVEEAPPLRPVEFLTLVVLGDGALHGYGIVQQIDERTGGKVQLRPGDVYRVLYRMRRRGLIDKADRRSVAALGDQRRTYYRLTELGWKVARAEAEMLSELATGLLAPRGDRNEAAP